MIYNGVVISDIHFDAIPSKQLYSQLNKVFLKELRKMEKLDIIVIAGDLLHHKISFNSETARLCIKFIEKLVSIAKKKDAKVRILKGTRNHDLDQLNNFYYLENDPDVDFRIINTVTSEKLFPNLKVLWLPEEYMEDKEEYYREYFSEKYDLCFGHGTFKHTAFMNQELKTERPIKNAPIFDYNELNEIVHGPIIFGHIHEASKYKGKVFYCGSFTRWSFGEEKRKGFRTFQYSTKKKSYKVGFKENILAETYITMDLSELLEDEEKTIEEKIKIIEEMKEEKGIDHLRIRIGKTSDITNLSLLKKYFEDDNEVKITSENIQRSVEEEDNRIEEEYSFIFNKEFSIVEIISRYLSKHDNIIIKDERIDEILHSE